MCETVIVPATQGHVVVLALRIRQADKEEVWAGAHMSPAQVLHRSLRYSTHAWTAFIGGEIVAMWGVAPRNILAGVGVPWLLSSETVTRYPMTFLRQCRRHLSDITQIYPTLRNYVDDRYATAQCWLTWLGFTLGEPEPWGVEGLPFRPFELVSGGVRQNQLDKKRRGPHQ